MRVTRHYPPRTPIWKKGKDPHPQDKIQHLDFTKDPRPLYYKTPPCVFYHKIVCSKAVFRSLVRTKLALSKTGCFLSKAEVLEVGVFSPLSTYACRIVFCLLPNLKCSINWEMFSWQMAHHRSRQRCFRPRKKRKEGFLRWCILFSSFLYHGRLGTQESPANGEWAWVAARLSVPKDPAHCFWLNRFSVGD